MKLENDSWENEAIEADTASVSRRDFLALSGSGLFLFFWVGPLEAFQEPARLPARPGYPSDFNAYLRIGPEGRVTCFVGKVELGQGAMTSLPMLLAEELDVALDSVDIVMGDTDLCPWDMGTFGSLSIRQFGPVLRGAGAEARAVLLQMAAERLGAPVERLQVKDGVVTDPSTGKHVAYAELVQGKRIERHIGKVALKPVSAFAVHGKSPARRDGPEKVTGKAKYAGDMLLPGMLHARILRPPAHDAVLKQVDTSAAEKVEGVRIVREGDLIAVLHERPDIAEKAKALIKAEYDRPQATVDDRSIFDHLLKNAPPPQVVGESGSLAEGEKLAATIVEETYLNSYVAHAPMETHSATATIENDKITVWAGTQTPFSVKQQVAQALRLAPENVRVITPYVGGGFGGKSASRQAVEAARLAKLTGKPVQVVWDRSEEFFYDTFRPAAVVKIRAGLDQAGRMTLWDFKVFCAGDREAKHFYDIPHQRTVSSGGWGGGSPAGLHPFAVGPWRAPSVNTNTFARESHIDILARKAAVDPVEFRMKHLTDKRMRVVLEAAAKQFGWKPAPTPSGRGVGVACAIYMGTYVATMAEVAVDKATGKVQVKRVVCAQDQGVMVNRDGSRQQMEGSIMMGLGYALTEEVHFRGQEVLEHNFDSYEIPRFSWLPKIETVLIDNPEVPASGCGEPPIVGMGAVVANAIHDAVGARLLQLPMTPSRIKAALQRG
ncbi:MAG TPA: molybdopterin cofactor-binding domain-containing protein [Terriglobales bacterium]